MNFLRKLFYKGPPKQITVKVTQRHIDTGKRSSTGHCPIALALKEQFPVGRHTYVSVGVYEAKVPTGQRDDKDSVFTYHIPIKGQMFVRSFDTLGPTKVNPITLTLTRE